MTKDYHAVLTAHYRGLLAHCRNYVQRALVKAALAYHENEQKKFSDTDKTEPYVVDTCMRHRFLCRPSLRQRTTGQTDAQ